jgi:hypothetical protein
MTIAPETAIVLALAVGLLVVGLAFVVQSRSVAVTGGEGGSVGY